MTERRGPGFTAALHEQIILGNKTMTRRVMKPQPGHDNPRLVNIAFAPHGQPGDVWALREPMIRWGGVARYADGVFATDRRASPRHIGWVWLSEKLASISMPTWAARDFVTLKRVWVERVQDISEEDVKAEGIIKAEWNPPAGQFWHIGSSVFIGDRRDDWVEAISHLWDSIYGKKPGCAYADNPYVWCHEFGEYVRDPGRKMAVTT